MPKKLKLLLVVMFILAGGIVFSLFFKISGGRQLATLLFKEEKIKYQPKEEKISEERGAVFDSDGDGLNDYEESLYNTDHLNPDTDQDGYLDGEEVIAGTDPLLAGPNDKIPSIEEARALYTNMTERALTSIFYEATSNNLYVQSGNDKKELNFATLDNIVRDAQINYILATTINPIEENEIKISNDNSPEAIKKYVLEFSDSVKDIFEFSLTQEGNLPKAALLSKPGNFKPIKDLFYQYNQKAQEVIDKLLDLTVPSDLKEIHLEAINLALSFQRLFLTTSQLEQDPIKAILAFGEIPTKIFEVNRIAQKLINYLDERNIKIPASKNYLLEIQMMLKVNPKQ